MLGYMLCLCAYAEKKEVLPVTFTTTGPHQVSYTIDSFEITSVENICGQNINRITYSVKGNNCDDLVEMVLCCYDSAGNEIEVVDFRPDYDYVDVPDTTAMLEISAKDGSQESDSYLYCKYTSVYANDGRVMEIQDLLVPLYESVGWSVPVTMYALDGRTIDISPYAVESYENVGWYTETNRLYIDFQEKYNKNKQSGKHYENMKLVKEYLPTFTGTEHESSLYAVRTEAMDLWRADTGAPIACAGYAFAERKEGTYVSILLANISYKNVISLKVEFDVVDAKGNPTGKKKDFYYATGANINPGETSVFVWKIDNLVNPVSISNFKVTEIVFEDATRWCNSN